MTSESTEINLRMQQKGYLIKSCKRNSVSGVLSLL